MSPLYGITGRLFGKFLREFHRGTPRVETSILLAVFRLPCIAETARNLYVHIFSHPYLVTHMDSIDFVALHLDHLDLDKVGRRRRSDRLVVFFLYTAHRHGVVLRVINLLESSRIIGKAPEVRPVGIELVRRPELRRGPLVHIRANIMVFARRQSIEAKLVRTGGQPEFTIPAFLRLEAYAGTIANAHLAHVILEFLPILVCRHPPALRTHVVGLLHNIFCNSAVIVIDKPHRGRPRIKATVFVAIRLALVVAEGPLELEAQVLGHPTLVANLNGLVDLLIARIHKVGHGVHHGKRRRCRNKYYEKRCQVPHHTNKINSFFYKRTRATCKLPFQAEKTVHNLKKLSYKWEPSAPPAAFYPLKEKRNSHP